MGNKPSLEEQHEREMAAAEKAAGEKQNGHIPEGGGEGLDEPVVVWNRRTVPDGGMAHYMDVHAAWSAQNHKDVPGFRSCMHSADPSTPNQVSDVQWWSSINAFRGHISMTNPGLMAKTKAFTDGCDNSKAYTGYTFGGWEQSAMMGYDIPHMFALPVFPVKMQAEVRGWAAGFIRKSKASNENGPLMVMSECIIKEGKVDEFVAGMQQIADAEKANTKVIAVYASKEVHRIKLGKESGHARNANKIVNLFAFEDDGESKSNADFVRVISEVGKLNPMLQSSSGEVWAKDAATAAAAKEILGGGFKAFPVPGAHAEPGGNNADATWSGYSNHVCDCKPTPALTQAECEAAEKKGCAVM